MWRKLAYTIGGCLGVSGTRPMNFTMATPASPHARGRGSPRIIEAEPTNVAQLRNWLPDELRRVEPDEQFIERAKQILNARIVHAAASLDAREMHDQTAGSSADVADKKAALLKDSKAIIDSFLKRQSNRWENYVMFRQYLHPDTHSNAIKSLDVELMRASYEDFRQTLTEIDGVCPPPAYDPALDPICPSYEEAVHHPRAMRRGDR